MAISGLARRAVAIAAGGWRWREKILGLVDQLLLLLLEIAEPVFGATPAILALLARRRCWARLHIKLE